MWPYQPVIAPRRRSSNSDAGPSTSPTSSTRVPSTYPPESYSHDHDHHDPRTPSQPHRRPLGRVDESPDNITNTSAGSRAPFVARDYADDAGGYYAASPASMTETHRSSIGGGGGMTSDSELDVTITTRTETASFPPDPDPRTTNDDHRVDMIPPVSVHDAYLSKHIKPLVPDSTTRPAVPRSTSVPVLQAIDPNATQTGVGGGLLPPIDVGTEGSGRAKPIFEIFDAAPGEGGKKLEKRLRGHLKDVLKVQEEIGKMHLALEGLGLGGMDTMAVDEEEDEQRRKEGNDNESEEDSLSRREKGVEALMEKLGMLSDTLRTYHDLGTPRLQFPSDRNRSPAEAHSDTALPSPSPPPMNRQQSAYPSIGGPSTLHTESPIPVSPHPLHKGIEDLKRNAAGDKIRKGSNNSDLPPLKLSVDDYDGPSSGLRKNTSPSRVSEPLGREGRESGHDHADSSLMGASHAGGAGERARFDYAIKQPVDRSRAW